MAPKPSTTFYRPAAVSTLEQGIRGMIKAPDEIGRLTADDVMRQIAHGHPCLPDQQKPDPEWIARRLQNGVHNAFLMAERMTAAGEELPKFFERFLVGLARAIEARGLHRLPAPKPQVSAATRRRRNGVGHGFLLSVEPEATPNPATPPDPNCMFIVHFYERYLKPVVERNRSEQTATATPLEVATR